MMSSFLAVLTAGLTLGVGGPVTGLSIAPHADGTDVFISIEGEVEFREFTMEGPHRLVVDVFGARHELPRDNFLDLRKGAVVSVRTSQYSAEVVRVVLELADSTPYEVLPAAGGLRVRLLHEDVGAFEPWSTHPEFPELSVPSTGGPYLPPSASAPAGGELDRPRPAPEASSRPRVGLPSRGTVALQADRTQEQELVDFEFQETPVLDVIQIFSDFSGASIVAGRGVEGFITAKIVQQPWEEALRTILEVNGFIATPLENGIIRVDAIDELSELEAAEPLFTRAYRINYAPAQEIQQAVTGILSPDGRGTVTVGQSTNAVIVNDISRVHNEVEALIEQLDTRTPSVSIQAKIVFVNRTALDEFGVTYDLKDSAGNQLNTVTPGAVDQDGDGVIELPDEQVDVGENVVSLGGNSVAALGNANNRVAGSTLTLLSSIILGRHTLVTFVEALESLNLSEIEASPHVRVADNQTARIQVGERTPIRVLDASGGAAGGAGGGGGGAGGAAGGGQGGAIVPVASVQIEETGIILEATPHVTDSGDILLELSAERSAPQLAESDIGLIFNTQEATTRVLVRNGETVVMGGLSVTEDNEVRSGIPMLMNLPVIGGLFRVTRESRVQRDLMILVTPTIVQDGA